MSPAFRALVAVIIAGTISGVSYSVFGPKAGVTDAQLSAANTSPGLNRQRVVQVYGPACPDGGYCRFEVHAEVWTAPDGGRDVYIKDADARAMLATYGEAWAGSLSTTDSTVPRGSKRFLNSFECACAASTSCKLTGSNRWGLANNSTAPFGVTLNAGEFQASAACIAKPCRQVAGRNSWPASCPGRG